VRTAAEMERVMRLTRGIAVSVLASLAATAAHAGAYVDRSLNTIRSLQAPSTSPPSTVPANAVRAVSVPGAADQPNGAGQANAYSVDAVSPIIYSKNVVYTTPFPLPSRLAGRATITDVAWKYGTKSRPAGFDAALCWNGAKVCRNISLLASGHTGAFNGRDATLPFALLYQVIGSSALTSPVYGDTAQIIVSYELWP
jgi:flagellar protein FlhE